MSGLALEVAYKEARVWRAEAEAARRMCKEWNELAIADGYGGGSVRAHEILDAMNKARAQHEAKEDADFAAIQKAKQP